MGELTTHILEKLADAREIEDLDECVWIAAGLIQKSRSPNYRSGVEEIDFEEVGEIEGKQLQNALLDALPRNANPRFAGSILSALSCARDSDLLSFWIENCIKYLEMLRAANGALYSILVALNELNEPIFQSNTVLSLRDLERNADEAARYLLKQRGIAIPW